VEEAMNEHNENLEAISEYDESTTEDALGDAGKSRGWIDPDPQP
jgi:hypothetical protein